MTITQDRTTTTTTERGDEPRGTLTVLGPMHDRFDEILTPEALDFVAHLHDLYENRRYQLLRTRELRRDAIGV